MSEASQLSRSGVLEAHEAIKPFVHRTPVLTSSSLSASLPGRNPLYFKAENLQKAGAFKFRGASHSLERLTRDRLNKGVCTHSSGEWEICALEFPAPCPIPCRINLQHRQKFLTKPRPTDLQGIMRERWHWLRRSEAWLVSS